MWIDYTEGMVSDVVITPHPGEMARLLGTTVDDVQANRIEIAKTVRDGSPFACCTEGLPHGNCYS